MTVQRNKGLSPVGLHQSRVRPQTLDNGVAQKNSANVDATKVPSTAAEAGNVDAAMLGAPPPAGDSLAVGSARAATHLEQRAVRTVDRDEKRALTRDAASAWTHAMAQAGSAQQQHKLQKLAARAYERLAQLTDDAAPRAWATAMANALQGDLVAAHAALNDVDGNTDVEALRASLQRALAVAQVRTQVAAVSSIPTAASPAQAAALRIDALRTQMTERPSRALTFAALAVQAAARGGLLPEQLAALRTLVSQAAVLQRQAGCGSTGERALALAELYRASGQTARAAAQYRKILRIPDASQAHLTAAQLGLALTATWRVDAERERASEAVKQAARKPSIAPLMPAWATRAVATGAPLPRATAADGTFVGVHPALVHADALGGPLQPTPRHAAPIMDLDAEATAFALSSYAAAGDSWGQDARFAAALGASVAAHAAVAVADNAAGRALRARSPSDAESARMQTWLPLLGAKTQGTTSLEQARALLLQQGLQEIPGSSDLRDGDLRVRLRPFSLAQTPSFTVDVIAGDGDDATRVHQQVHVGALVFAQDDWALFKQGYDATLARYQRLLHDGPANKRATTATEIRAFLSAGRDVSEIAARKAQIAEISGLKAELLQKLRAMKAAGTLPKAAMIIVDGIDAASKTTNGMTIKSLFEAMGFSGVFKSFKGPTAEERAQPYGTRYAAFSAQEGEVRLSDRGHNGDYAYNDALGPDDLAGMAATIQKMHRDMRDNGTFVINMLFDPRVVDPGSVDGANLDRPMVTFGKREMRALVARDLLARSDNTLTEAERLALEEACIGPGYNDLKSFHEGDRAMDRMLAYAKATQVEGGAPVFIIGTKDRHAGRLAMLRAAMTALDEWAARSATSL